MTMDLPAMVAVKCQEGDIPGEWEGFKATFLDLCDILCDIICDIILRSEAFTISYNITIELIFINK